MYWWQLYAVDGKSDDITTFLFEKEKVIAASKFSQKIWRFWHLSIELIGWFYDPEVKVNAKLILMRATLPVKHNYLSAKSHLCTHLLITTKEEKC